MARDGISLFALLVIQLCGIITQPSNAVYREFATNEERGLFPNIFNLATNALIKADATCGQNRSDKYCKLVEHVFNRVPQCDVCNANDVSKRHPIEFAIDGTPRWWQSPSLANGLEYERVNITIDLRQEYQVAYIIVKSAIAPRPGTWVLEKSLDGITFEPWQYYAATDADCMHHFGIPATTGVPKFTRDDEVICTSAYSKLDPLENGEIHTSLVNGRPSAEAASEVLQNFTRTRFVRLRLITPRTLNADLMIINRGAKKSKLDPSVTRRYFYAIKDISIGGQCICYGHAERCPPDPVTGQFRCECRHNTYGESCHKCRPLYNQLPWMPGTQKQPHICQACQCFNHADRCEYDSEIARLGLSVTPEGIFEGGGKCINCKHNTDGINCERCKWTFYRPSGITHYREDACRPCSCDPLGSEHNNCVRDETSAINGQHPGDCICKYGFGGRRCDRCAPGYRNYPKCDPCPCNQAGSLNFDTCEEDKCVCKKNVEGLYCDRCKPGTINLDINNPQGCQQCFCFGVGLECHEKLWHKGEIRNNYGWTLTDLRGVASVKPVSENGELLMFNAKSYPQHTLYYWKAPATFLGNRLNSYGGVLRYYVYFVPSSEGDAVPIADIIIEGNGIKLEYHSRQDFFPRENMSVQIPLKEGTGWYNSQLRVPVDKIDLMRALVEVDYIMVRAVFHSQQLQSSIYGLTLDVAEEQGIPQDMSENDVLKPAKKISTIKSVEKCVCPKNFAGSSCEACVHGYRRVNNQLYGGRCEKCDCTGHSDKCDPFTGRCIDCQHNTRGPRCEKCLPGHYGNPSLGGEAGQCRPCACPTVENSHSSECVLSQLVIGGVITSDDEQYVCTACERGYDGNKCEMCADGYYGNPRAVNGSCQPCECNDNVDPMSIGACDSETGLCLKCIYNTAGDHCEVCKENHWGNAKEKSCRSCGCHPKGSKTAACDSITGECECNENYVGRQCDRCRGGHGDIDNNCPKCSCDAIGSFGRECDEVSGQCACKRGVYGKQCDMCRPGYFNFTSHGCQFCNCNQYGAVDDGKCNNITGKCECRANVDGNMCEKCADGFFNITSGHGCEQCECSPIGSNDINCNVNTGQCVCKPGVTGRKCDQCVPNYYGLDESGCKKCKECPAPGQICDPLTGDCVCPRNTVGEMCERCAPNAWNHDPYKGCSLCDCSDIGAYGTECDPISGQCKCRSEYVGLKCDHCTHGYYKFPECHACKCDLAGTDPKACGKNGMCLCDENGQCPCKKNVKGLKCDVCDTSSFSLDASNPLGCTECFCFNRTNFCVQTSLIWQQVYAEDRQITFAEPWEYYTRKYNINLLKEHPTRYNSYPTDNTPLYWPLPKRFHGDRTASYNGFIRFRIDNDDNRLGVNSIQPDPTYFRHFPQVILVGNHRIILEHIPKEVSADGRYRVRLHENEWHSRLSPDVPVTREQMMIALQNVQGIFVRATYNYPSRGDAASIKEISLDVAVWQNTTDKTNTTAIGVEMCECPQGYSGNSCQEPAVGYYRKRRPDYLDSENDLDLVGYSEPCACNEHSATCEPETGRCTNCRHDTFGDYCQYCKPGYYGDALEGGSTACMKCACPLADNSFSETCVKMNHGRGYLCNGCKRGYTGIYCESCMSGYFGDPNKEGGFCEECGCHPDGSLNPACDPSSGQCECRPGVTGRDCSLCQERHAFLNGFCTSCDQGCTKELMLMLDDIGGVLNGQDFSNLRPIPWKRVSRIENMTRDMYEILGSVRSGKTDAESLFKELSDHNKYLKEANTVADQAKFLKDRSIKSAESLDMVVDGGIKISKDAQQQFRDLSDIVEQLKYFIRHGGTKQDVSNISEWISKAKKFLDKIIEDGEYIEKRYHRGLVEFEKADRLFKKITSNKLNDTSFDGLRVRLEGLSQWINSYRDAIWDDARKNTLAAMRISDIVSKRIDRYKDVSAEISELLGKANDDLAKSEKLVESSKSDKLLSMYDNFKEVKEVLMPATKAKMQKCRDEADKFAQVLDEYRKEYAVESAKHADKLEAEAEKLGSLFEDTKVAAENSMKASNAYAEIVNALRNASRAAEEAKLAAAEAYIDADSKSDTSMVNMAIQSKEDSLMLKEEANKLNLGDLEDQRAEYVKRLNNVKDGVTKGMEMKKSILNQYQSFDDQHDRMRGLASMAVDAKNKAAEIQRQTKEMADSIDNLDESLRELKNFAGAGIRNITDNIREANKEVQSAMLKVKKVNKQAKEHETRIGDLGFQISLLKEKIKEAREMASRIRISVKSDESGSCRRSFISPARPSPANNISVKYRPHEGVPDSLIFLSKTKSKRTQASEYMAIELLDRRIIAHWNIGAGPMKATNMYTVNYLTANDRSAWYHIDLNRIGNAVILSVGQTMSGEGVHLIVEPLNVTVGRVNPENDVIFNTVPGETTIQLGCDPAVADELGLSTNRFYGTIGELTVDSENLPLWAFSMTNRDCEGDFAVPTTRASGHMFKDGFAQIKMSLAERVSGSVVSVIFAAYSPDGLLYFRGSQTIGDFLSIELRDGRVVFKINLGGGSYVSVQSKKAFYTDGLVHTVRAVRNNDQIHLQVDSESDRSSATIPGTNTMLNVMVDDHYVGGVPPGFNTSVFQRFDIHWTGFFGCIQSIKPSQVTELDLDNPIRSQGKLPGCSFKAGKLEPTDHVFGFPQPGYLVTQGIQLSDNSSVGFNFRTREANATLLFQSTNLATYRRRERRIASDEGQGYIGFYLHRGILVVHIGTDSSQRSKMATLRSLNTYNDGQLHSVFLSREETSILLRIDDRLVVSSSLSDRAMIGAPETQMFIGGFPEKVKPSSNEIPFSEPLIGCISDIYNNYKFVPITPEAHIAIIGFCPIDAKFTTIPPADGVSSVIGKLPTDPPSPKKTKKPFDPYTHLTTDTPEQSVTIKLSTPQTDVSKTSQSSAMQSHEESARSQRQCGPDLIAETDGKHAAYYGVSETSHTRLNFVRSFGKEYPSVEQFKLELSFRTSSPDGILWIWANYKNYTRYFYLFLENGFLKFSVKGHRNPKTFTIPSEKLDDGEWHDVRIIKHNREGSVKIDALPEYPVKDISNPRVMQKRMYVAGVISKHRKRFTLLSPPFVGCIRDFILNDEPLDLFLSAPDVLPCSSRSRSAYVHDRGYMTFEPLKVVGSEETIRISVQFRPAIENGLIFGLMTNKDPEKYRITVSLTDGKLTFELVYVKIRRDLKHVLKTDVCDGRWHNITLHISPQIVFLELDSVKERLPTKASSVEAIDLFRSLPINVGGVSARTAEKISATSLVGCYRNLRLANTKVSLSRAKRINKVVPNMCPFMN